MKNKTWLQPNNGKKWLLADNREKFLFADQLLWSLSFVN